MWCYLTYACKNSIKGYYCAMATDATLPTIFGEAHLAALAERNPDDLTVGNDELQQAFAGFEPSMAILYDRTDDEERGTYTIHFTGERGVSAVECAINGLQYVRPPVEFERADAPTFYGRCRAARLFMESEEGRQYTKSVLEQGLDAESVYRHFFVYGVALGLKMRREAQVSQQAA